MSWKIDEVTETEAIASRPITSPADVTALLQLVAQKLAIPVGTLEYGGPASGRNRARIVPLKSSEEQFAAAAKQYNS